MRNGIRPMQGAALVGLSLLLLIGCSDEDSTSAPESAPESSDESIASEPGDKAPEDPDTSIRSIEIDTGEFTFDALEAGPEDGELVVLLHGFPQTADQWRSQIAALSAAGYHVVAPNQRGYSPGAVEDSHCCATVSGP